MTDAPAVDPSWAGTTPDATPPAAIRRRWAALLVLCAGQLMIILDGSIVNVALPAIQSDLAFSPAGLAWVVNAYLVPFGGLLLLCGRVGDLVGRRRVLEIGLVVFTVASLLCGVSASPAMLVVSRFVQGAGGALASAVVLGMIVTLFPEPREQGKALGVFTFVGAAGSSIGLLLGGILTEALSWHWVFLVNVPLGIAAVLYVRRLVPADVGRGRGADVLGAVLVTAGLMTAVYTLITMADAGRSAAASLLLGAVALGLLAAFVVRQARAETPLLPLRLLRSGPVAVGNGVQALMVASLFGFQFLGVLYLQRVLGYGPTRTGLAYLPVALTIAAISLGLTAALIARLGRRPVLLVGLAAIAVGLALLARLPADGRYVVDILPASLLLAVGFGLAFPALAALAVVEAPPRDAGAASGLFNTTQQVGGAFGLAILASLAAARTRHEGAAGATEALLSGYRLAFVGAAVLAGAALLLAAATLGRIDAGTRAARAPADAAPCPEG